MNEQQISQTEIGKKVPELGPLGGNVATVAAEPFSTIDWVSPKKGKTYFARPIRLDQLVPNEKEAWKVGKVISQSFTVLKGYGILVADFSLVLDEHAVPSAMVHLDEDDESSHYGYAVVEKVEGQDLDTLLKEGDSAAMSLSLDLIEKLFAYIKDHRQTFLSDIFTARQYVIDKTQEKNRAILVDIEPQLVTPDAQFAYSSIPNSERYREAVSGLYAWLRACGVKQSHPLYQKFRSEFPEMAKQFDTMWIAGNSQQTPKLSFLRQAFFPKKR